MPNIVIKNFQSSVFNHYRKANAEIGFQPETEHLPAEVEDTEAVKAAREQFLAGYEAMKVRLAQAEKERLENKVSHEEITKPPFHPVKRYI